MGSSGVISDLDKPGKNPLGADFAEMFIFAVRNKVVLTFFALPIALLGSAVQTNSTALRQKSGFGVMKRFAAMQTFGLIDIHFIYRSSLFCLISFFRLNLTSRFPSVISKGQVTLDRQEPTDKRGKMCFIGEFPAGSAQILAEDDPLGSKQDCQRVAKFQLERSQAAR